jgi:hypothetical protein
LIDCPFAVAFEDFVNMARRMTKLIRDTGGITHKATEFRKFSEVGDRRQPVRLDEVHHALELDEEDRVRDEEHAVGPFPDDRSEHSVKLGS